MTAKTKPKFTIAGIDPEARANKGREFEIKDTTTGEGAGMFISVVGKESTAYKAEFRKRLNALRSAEISRGDAPAKARTVEQDIADAIEVLAACTTGWRGIVINEEEGELEFTPENVRRLYAYDFVRLQVDAEVSRETDFTPG